MDADLLWSQALCWSHKRDLVWDSELLCIDGPPFISLSEKYGLQFQNLRGGEPGMCVQWLVLFLRISIGNKVEVLGLWTISFLEVVYVWENIFLGEMFVHEGDILLRMLWTLRNIKPWLLMACKDTYCLMLLRTQRQNRFQAWIFLCLFPSRAVSYGCSNKIHAACSLIQSSRKREEFLF